MTDMYPVILRVGRATSSHTHQQNHFLISGVFGPPALRNPINEFVQQLVLLVMYRYLCNLIRVDHASCWSHLKPRFTTLCFLLIEEIITNSIMHKEKGRKKRRRKMQKIYISSTLTITSFFLAITDNFFFLEGKAKDTSSQRGKPREPL